MPSFDPERGTGQGDVSSPYTWVAVFDIVLAALDLEEEGTLMIEDAKNQAYKAPDVGYADDLVSNMGSLKGLQAKADLISACTMILGLSIAPHKLRVYRYDWARADPPPPEEQEFLIIHGWGWAPQQVPIQYGGEMTTTWI